MEELDKESQHIREVYAKFGLAMYLAQCVERGIGLLLALDPEPMTRSRFQSRFDSSFKLTLGRLLNKLKESSLLSENFESKLEEGNIKRNWLAHRYFWDRTGHFASEEGRSKMLEELQELINLFDQIDNELTRISEELSSRHGITEEKLKEALEKILNSVNNEL